MKLYDETIKEWLKILDSLQGRELDVKKGEDWKDIGNANMILRSDMAYELGGNHLPALSGMTLTADTKDRLQY